MVDEVVDVLLANTASGRRPGRYAGGLAVRAVPVLDRPRAAVPERLAELVGWTQVLEQFVYDPAVFMTVVSNSLQTVNTFKSGYYFYDGVTCF